MLTFTSGSTGSGTISQKLHNPCFISFQLLDPLNIEDWTWEMVTPCWPLLRGQSEVGPYLKNYTTDFQFFLVIDSFGIGDCPLVTLTPCWPFFPGQPEVGPYLKKYQPIFKLFSIIYFLALNVSLVLPWPHIDLNFRVNRKWDQLSSTTHPIFNFISVINLLCIED